jgi:hypothetical protein
MDDIINAGAFEQIDESRLEGGKKEEPEGGKKEEPKEVNYLELVNKELGSEYKDISSLKDDLEFKTKYQELSKVPDEWKKKYDTLRDSFDVNKLFADEGIMKLNELRKKYPDINPSMAAKVLSSELSKMSEIDKIVLYEKYKNPSLTISDDDVKEAVMKELDVDSDDKSTWTGAQRFLAEKKALEAQKTFSEMQNVKVTPLDLEGLQKEKSEESQLQTAKIQESWKPKVKELISEIESKGIEIKSKNEKGEEELLYSFKVDNNFKTKFDEYLKDFVESGEEPTEANIIAAKKVMESDYISENISKIIKDHGNQIKTKLIEQYEIDIHNPKFRNESEAPVTETEFQSSDGLTNLILGNDKKEPL